MELFILLLLVAPVIWYLASSWHTESTSVTSSPSAEADTIVTIAHGIPLPIEEAFRYPEDPPHVIRLKHASPGGKTLAREVEVAGISHEPARSHAAALMAGTDRGLRLERDPTNRYDPAAIKVIGLWTNADGTHGGGQVGWIPKAIAQDIAKELPDAELDATIWKMFVPGAERSPGLRIDLWYHEPWRPAAPKANTRTRKRRTSPDPS